MSNADASPRITYFRGIEGLRAWLALSVVLSHILLFPGILSKYPSLAGVSVLGDTSVLIFIIISGFVITNLLLVKRETYLQYIVRRFLRIYPVYFICLILGMIGTYMAFASFISHPWGTFPLTDRMSAQELSLEGAGFWEHLIAHLTLVHGMISSRWLYESQYMFLDPAWSLSLEWQFYLVAPLVVFGLKTPVLRILTALLCVVAYLAFIRGNLGSFYLPSFLPGATPYFAAGIATRLLIHQIPRPHSYPIGSLVMLAAFVVMTLKLLPFLVWFAFIAWMVMDPCQIGHRFGARSLFSKAFESRQSRWLGDRSYSIYLLHFPIIQILCFVAVRTFQFSMLQTTAACLVLVPFFTLLLAAAMYRAVEKPFINFGSSLFKTVELREARA